MALIKCPECKKKVSDQCGKCPHCGYPIETVETPITETKEEVAEKETAVEAKTDEPAKERKPINKKILIGIISAAVVLLTVGGFLGYNALLPRINATKAFDEAVNFVEQKNIELENEISESEKLIAKKQPLLDETLISSLENAISDAKSVKITDFETPNKVEDIISRTEELNKTDYSETITNLNNKHTAVEINAKRYQLVNKPTEAYIIQRLQTIPEITGIAAVTEDNDPNGNLNKAGGYTSTVYFSHKSVNQKDVYGDTLIDKGTDAGGAIEVYTCVEDAIKRRDYLATFDGSILASGTHTVIGTVLVRTSNELTASLQKELEAKIISALTYIEEFDSNKETINEQKPEESKPTNNTLQSSTPSKSDDKERAMQLAIEMCGDPVADGATARRTWLKSYLIETGGFSETVADYVVKSIDYDWNASALFYAEAYKNWGNDVSTIPSLLANDGYTNSEINYACENADWNQTTVNKNQQAISAAEEIANFYATVSPYMVRDILINDYGFTDTQAIYAIQNSQIQWDLHACWKMEEYVGMNEGNNITKDNIVTYMATELGFSANDIDYAFGHAFVLPDENGYYYYTN